MTKSKKLTKIVAILTIIALLFIILCIIGIALENILAAKRYNTLKTFDLRNMSYDTIDKDKLTQYDAIVGYDEQIQQLAKSDEIKDYVENGGKVIIAMEEYKSGSIGYLVEDISDDRMELTNISGNLMLTEGETLSSVDYSQINYDEVIEAMSLDEASGRIAEPNTNLNYDYGTQSKAIMRSYLLNTKGNITATMIITARTHRLGTLGDASAWAHVINVDLTPGSKVSIYRFQVAHFEIGIMEYAASNLDHYEDNGGTQTITLGTTISSNGQVVTVGNTYSTTYTVGELSISRRSPVIDNMTHSIWVCEPTARENDRPFSAVVGGIYIYDNAEDVGMMAAYVQNIKIVSSPWGRTYESPESTDSNQVYCASIINSYVAKGFDRSFILGMSNPSGGKGSIQDIDDGDYDVSFEGAGVDKDDYGPIYHAVALQ